VQAIFLAAIFCQGRKVDLVSTSPISSSILSKSWVCLSPGFPGYVEKLCSLHHIPGYRIS
jgi:hypothetical protein